MSGFRILKCQFLQDADTLHCPAKLLWIGRSDMRANKKYILKRQGRIYHRRNFRSSFASQRKQTFLTSLPVNNVQWCKVVFHYQVSKVSFCFPAGSSISNHHCAAASRRNRMRNWMRSRHASKSIRRKWTECTNSIIWCSYSLIYPSNLSTISQGPRRLM